MKKRIFGLALLTSVAFSSIGFAQSVKITKDERAAAEKITAAQMKDYLYYVASDEMEGRDTPSKGLDLTAKFIGTMLSRWGFKPAGDDGTFFQKIALKREFLDEKASSVSINGENLVYGEDVFRVSGTGNDPINAPFVYVGDGWMVKSKGLNPYAGLDVKGKIVVAYSEGPIGGRSLVPMPQGVTQADLTGKRGEDWADVMTYSSANGAAAVVILPSKFLQENMAGLKAMFGRSRASVEKLARPQANPAMRPVPTFIVSPKATESIFKGEQNPLTAKVQPYALADGKKANFTLVTKAETLWTQNVVAIWEGSDPKLKNEMVAVGAHYDHVGMNPNTPGDDKISNGADDDGSGTVAVLAMAEALANAKARPKRSVLLVWHCGEEKGLWGSDYFNKFPTVDIKNVIAQLNIDMIGRSRKSDDSKPANKDLSGENSIYVIGSQMMSSTLGNISDGVNKAYLNLDYDKRYDDPKDTNRFFFRSDHFNYALNGIPIVFWFDGVHEDYHRVSDHADKIDYAKMEKVTRTIFLTMWELTDLKSVRKLIKNFRQN